MAKAQFDARNVEVMNNYAFKRINLSFKYANETTIDIKIPVIDNRSDRNVLNRTTNTKKIRIIKSNIPKIDNEFFKIIKA